MIRVAAARADKLTLAVGIGLLLVAGVACGWRFGSSYPRLIDYVYAIAVPAPIASIGGSALLREAKLARWLVPLLLLSVTLSVVARPHALVLTVGGVLAGLLATLAILQGWRRTSAVGTVVCCLAISASLLVGLAQ